MENRSNIILRFAIIIGIIFVCSAYIVLKASRIVFVEGSYWQEKADSLKIEDLTILPNRGNILATDGRLMASSLPEYFLYIDFRADGVTKANFEENIKPLCAALSAKFRDRSASQYETHLRNGYKKAQTNLRYRSCLIYPKKVSFTDLKEVKQFPYLKQGPNRSGFHYREMVSRIRPFGSLAHRTIGDVYQDRNMGAKYGLELTYDSLLRGTSGTSSRQKMGGRWISVTAVEPQHGLDIKTTIDVDIQDISENALVKMLEKTQATLGTAIVMDVKSGHIKAIANFTRTSSGAYAEIANHAVASQAEPGSTFKTVSMMIALDEGIVSPADTFDTGNGIYKYGGSYVRDHNWRHGGYGKITAAQAIWYSSNVATAKIILKGYEDHPEKYVDAIYKMGLNTPVHLGIPGEGEPVIPHPKTNPDKWYKTKLPWMSFGYETQIPPIYTLMFYNAIANDGEMIKPIFVQEILDNGHVVEEFETETLNRSICKRETLKEIRQMLLDVVEQGTASAVKSPYIKIAGKTGTALISQGNKGYGSASNVSFCGYFPADEPQYSAMVMISHPRIGYPSGGTMAGGVVRQIAEQVHAQGSSNSLDELTLDTIHPTIPKVKGGFYPHTQYALRELDVDYNDEIGDSRWQSVSIQEDEIVLNNHPIEENLVPNVVGMGARDAVYLMEQAGLRVTIVGNGRVTRQSIMRGTKATKGRAITLYLS